MRRFRTSRSQSRRNVGTEHTLAYARSLSAEYIAVHVALHPERIEYLKKRWQQLFPEVKLVILESPYRSLIEPLMNFLDVVHAKRPNHYVTVIIGESVTTRRWHTLLQATRDWY